MIVLGADTHKASHTLAALEEATGRVLEDRTVRARRRSFEDVLRWARGLGSDRVWAIEDCRHVSGALERFLLTRGERVVRVSPRLMGDARRSSRERGKSDAIDAVTIARAALREGLDTLAVAQLAGAERDVRLLVDHRERLVGQRTALINDLRWGLHDLSPEFEIPPRALIHGRWQDRVAGRLARAPQSVQVRIARDELRRIRELTRAIDALERELAALVAALAPQLVAERGCGVLTAAKHRRDRRRRALRLRRQARAVVGNGTAPRLLGQHAPPPPRPGRQPPAQLRPAPPRRQPRTAAPADRRLSRPQAGRRQDPPRSAALPQAPPRPPNLEAPATGPHKRPPRAATQDRHHPLRHPLRQLSLT
jgi:transposase